MSSLKELLLKVIESDKSQYKQNNDFYQYGKLFNLTRDYNGIDLDLTKIIVEANTSKKIDGYLEIIFDENYNCIDKSNMIFYYPTSINIIFPDGAPQMTMNDYCIGESDKELNNFKNKVTFKNKIQSFFGFNKNTETIIKKYDYSYKLEMGTLIEYISLDEGNEIINMLNDKIAHHKSTHDDNLKNIDLVKLENRLKFLDGE